MATFIALLVICVLVLVGVVQLWSRGKAIPFVDENGNPLPGSLSEKIRVNINGIEQGMFIKSKDAKNPVLLFLHGGPGMPTYFLTERYPTGLEEYFTVVWWEQRGAGLSYHSDMPPESMTVEQLIVDALEVTNYLRNRFGQEKIYLMGHSWGSFLGIQIAARAPHLYHGYIGVEQVTYQLKSEKLAYDYMLARFKENGNTNMVRRLEQAPVTMAGSLPDSYDMLRDEAMHSLGIGTTRDMRSVITGIFLPSWFCREYTLSEKINLWRGKVTSKEIFWDEFMMTDLTQKVTKLELPVYFVHGIYDYTVSYPETKAYFEALDAPVKGFYTFENSAHSPMHEEPEKMRNVLFGDVLLGATHLADAP